MYLHVYFLDGEEEHHFIKENSQVRDHDGVLHWYGGDGSYQHRVTQHVAYPLTHVKRWIITENKDDKP